MSVRKKGNKWYCRFQIDGRRYELACKGAVDKPTAIEFEKNVNVDMMRGNFEYVNRIKPVRFEELVETFLVYSKNNKRSYQNDVYYCDKFKEFFRNKYVSEITKNHIEDWKSWRLKHGVAENTVNRELNSLSKMFNVGIEYNLINNNPCSRIPKFKVLPKKDKIITLEEQEILLSKLTVNILTIEEQEKIYKNSPQKSEQNRYKLIQKLKKAKDFEGLDKLSPKIKDFTYLYDIVFTDFYTGMRKGEILPFEWSQIDFKKRTLRVIESKNNRIRIVPIADKLYSYLLKLKQTSTSKYVFPNKQTDKPYDDVKKSFREATILAKLEGITFNDIRQTVSTRLLESGIDVKTASEILGNSPATLLKHYTRMNFKHKENGVNVLNNY